MRGAGGRVVTSWRREGQVGSGMNIKPVTLHPGRNARGDLGGPRALLTGNVSERAFDFPVLPTVPSFPTDSWPAADDPLRAG